MAVVQIQVLFCDFVVYFALQIKAGILWQETISLTVGLLIVFRDFDPRVHFHYDGVQ